MCTNIYGHDTCEIILQISDLKQKVIDLFHPINLEPYFIMKCILESRADPGIFLSRGGF